MKEQYLLNNTEVAEALAIWVAQKLSDRGIRLKGNAEVQTRTGISGMTEAIVTFDR